MGLHDTGLTENLEAFPYLLWNSEGILPLIFKGEREQLAVLLGVLPKVSILISFGVGLLWQNELLREDEQTSSTSMLFSRRYFLILFSMASQSLCFLSNAHSWSNVNTRLRSIEILSLSQVILEPSLWVRSLPLMGICRKQGDEGSSLGLSAFVVFLRGVSWLLSECSTYISVIGGFPKFNVSYYLL